MHPQAGTWTANEGLPSAAAAFDRKQTILCRCHQRIGNGEVWGGKWGQACMEPTLQLGEKDAVFASAPWGRALLPNSFLSVGLCLVKNEAGIDG